MTIVASNTVNPSSTFEDRVAAVASLDFTPRQAGFLTLVALHSGYCMRRQYASFAGLGYGKNVRGFLERLVERQFARSVVFRADRGHVYHLFGRSIYAALGQEDNRNRRYASPAVIARKLMLLDFVLERPDRDWYVTEPEKVELFTTRFGVPSHALPRRTYDSLKTETDPTVRYFIHKLPIFLTEDPPRVHFVCLVTDPAANDVPLFVRDHRALLTHLPSWTLVIVRAAHISTDERCEQQFTFAVRAGHGETPPLDLGAVQHFFEARVRIEAGNFRDMSVTDISRFREARDRFGHRLDGLYSRWLDVGSAALARPATPHGEQSFSSPARVRVHRLPHRYEQFGALPGVS